MYMAAPERISVMVVDDQSDVRFLVRLTLEEDGGFDVVAEADGLQRAFEALDAADPDVIVMDARMPLVDGFEAAPQILERRPGQPIVLLTGLVDDQIRARADRAGIRAVVSKDDFESLAEVLRAAVSRTAAPAAPSRPAHG